MIETREVLAGAYLARRPRMMHSHAVEVIDGAIVRVLCRRVALDSLADRHASDPAAPPSCRACQRAAAKLQQGTT